MWAAIIAGLVAAVGAGINYFTGKKNRESQQQTNEADRQWQEDMYMRQLTDSQAMWDKQNQYNSPASQMTRYQQAGLNPHLIYGQSNMSQAINVPGVGSWNPKAPEMNFDATQGIHTYNNLRTTIAQTSNMEAQNQLLKQQAIQSAAQTAKIAADTKTSEFDLGVKSDLRQTSLDAARANLNNLITQTQISQDQNKRAQELHPGAIKQQLKNLDLTDHEIYKMSTQVDLMFKQIQGTEWENRIKQAQSEMWQNGVNPNDPTWLRLLLEWVIPKGDNGKAKVPSSIKGLYNMLQYFTR